MNARHGSWGLVCALLVASCGSSGGSSLFGPSGPDAGRTGSSGGASGGGGGALGGGGGGCANGSAVEGCACTGAGQTAACWTGPAADRHRGDCHDGTATCVQHGEFAAWGPCQGEQLDCGTAGTGGGGSGDAGSSGPGAPPAGNDAGPTGSTGGGNQVGPCACNPGAIIWCDEDCVSGVYCSNTGQKQCLPDGTWGPCHETSNPRPPNACFLAGLGCASCNGGRGYLMGDCTAAFACSVPPPPSNCSVSANVQNGVAVVTCDCH